MKINEKAFFVYKSSKILNKLFSLVEKEIKEGISTFYLDKFIEKNLIKLGGIPGAKGYNNYPFSSCISLNNELCHGVPKKNIILKNGDFVKIDIIVKFRDYYSDGAKTFIVGKGNKEKRDFLKKSRTIMEEGIKQCVSGKSLWDISFAVVNKARELNLNIVDNFCGHFIGKEIHEKPQIIFFLSEESKEKKLKSGDILTIEPVVTTQPVVFFLKEDGWTYFYPNSNVLSSHFENTVLVKKNKPICLSKL